MSASTSVIKNPARVEREIHLPQIDPIIVTPEEVVLKCTLRETSEALPLYELGKGIAENYRTENDIEANTVRVYFYLHPTKNKREIFIRKDGKNWSDLFESINPDIEKEVYLDSFTYPFPPRHLLGNVLSQGFTEEPLLKTTPIFIAVNIGKMLPGLVDKLIKGFNCCYNSDILLISCQISIQKDIIEKLKTFGLNDSKDYRLVNIIRNETRPSSLVFDLPWLKYYTSADNRTVTVFS